MAVRAKTLKDSPPLPPPLPNVPNPPPPPNVPGRSRNRPCRLNIPLPPPPPSRNCVSLPNSGMPAALRPTPG
ncbi:hypothetical protein B7486_04060 [cyanobacterium TDX16]|nr:hypothetical protein B7486_04060 [cyanobacterium TDX16]